MTLAVAALTLALGILAIPEPTARVRLQAVASAGSAGSSSTHADEMNNVGIRRSRLSTVLALSAGGFTAVMAFELSGWVVALGAGVAAVVVCGWFLRRREAPADPLSLATGFDLLAACLRAGLATPVAVRAAAEELTGNAAQALVGVADSLRLGADPLSGWESALGHPETAELARAARQAGRTGSGLAGVAEDMAQQARATVGERAQVRAQRAAVWVSAPLGLCFLPAFFCLGILPVVVGMVENLAGLQ